MCLLSHSYPLSLRRLALNLTPVVGGTTRRTVRRPAHTHHTCYQCSVRQHTLPHIPVSFSLSFPSTQLHSHSSTGSCSHSAIVSLGHSTDLALILARRLRHHLDLFPQLNVCLWHVAHIPLMTTLTTGHCKVTPFSFIAALHSLGAKLLHFAIIAQWRHTCL